MSKKKNEPIKDQLKPKHCPHSQVVTQTNSKGKEFLECEKCGAFLGFK